MNRHPAWLAMLLISAIGFGSAASYAAESMDADRQAISKIERDWADAFKTHDKTALEKNLSDDFVFTDENGAFSKGRSAYVDGLVKSPKLADYSMSDVLITVHGSTAVVTGRFTAKDAAGTSDSTRFTDTFAKGTDGWKAIASQDTKTE
jgi:ketosteroid isomerase-like protein